ncbi:MAG: S1 RNA-binding domain-containing protein [Candidatus Aenigmarchaeota archaeon]|nr:S1 RNA-binding domain-containing protein [Candidatus Aenigmarchaeota archaeon]MDW8149439.1 S1 RNA-binding domain-containing protein [Candidatus Aenigmarchaeota archaeon]
MVRRPGIPEENELVVAKIYETSNIVAWCNLLEYPNFKGLIHISEAVGKWIYDINEVVKINDIVVAKVIKVEEKDNTVHLSLKRVSEIEKKEKMNEFRKEETAEKILERIAKKMNKNLDQAYEEVGFLLQKKFGYLFLAFDEIRQKENTLEKLKIDEEWKKTILEALKERYGEKITEIKYELNISSIEKNGINLITEILKELQNKNYKIIYLSAPRYLLKLSTKNPKDEERKIIKELENIKKIAENKKINFDFKRIK